MFVVAATFALTVAHRRRELALLRTIGATPRQVRRMLRREALTVGVAGSLIGTVAGAALAPALSGLLVRAGVEPAGFAVRHSPGPIAAAIALGPLVAALGVSVAARRASRVRPIEALRDAAVDQRPMGRARWAAGLLLTAAGLAGGVATATAADTRDAGSFALLGAMALVAGAAVLAPAVVPAVSRALTWPVRRLPGATALLVRQGALAAPRRTAATAAPVLLTVAFAVLVAGMVQTSTAAWAERRGSVAPSERVVVPDGTPGMSAAAVGSVGGVAILPTTVYAGDRPLTALAADEPWRPHVPPAAVPVLDPRGRSGVVAITASLAPAESLEVTMADGSRLTLRVVAVLDDGAIPGDLLVPRDLVRRHDPSALIDAVYPAAGGDLGPGARLIDTHTYAAEADAAEDRLVWIFTLLLITVSAGYGALAVVGTLLMSAGARRADLLLLRRSGATGGQVRRALAGEAALVVAVGCLLGGVVAALGLLGVRAGLSAQLGLPVPLVLPWPVIAAVAGVSLLLAMGAAVAPTIRVGRARS